MSTIYDAWKDGSRAKELEAEADMCRYAIQDKQRALDEIMRKIPKCDWPMTTPEAKAFKAGLAGREMPWLLVGVESLRLGV
jgi:hypothetical protein